MYRMMALLSSIDEPVSLDKIRLLDFYYAFPHLIKEISPWPSDISAYKKSAFKINNPFEKIVDKRRVFFEIAHIQKDAVSNLYAKGLLNSDKYKTGSLELNNTGVPKLISELIQKDDFINSEVFMLIVKGLTKTSWNGKGGLKDRSGLLEFKYDE
ncbi:MAG: hypothetical protein KC493_11330 [Bacteriovoracaceae bacterium]|nr:hypothetical protein [Bacteriovoracaceae bacterium]